MASQNIPDVQVTPTLRLRSGRIRSSSIPPNVTRQSMFRDDDISSIRPPTTSNLTKDFASDQYLVSPIGQGIGTLLLISNVHSRKTSEDSFMDERYVKAQITQFKAAVDWYAEEFPKNIRWSTAINDNFDKLDNEYKKLVNKISLIPTEGNDFKPEAIKELSDIRSRLINVRAELWKNRTESSFSQSTPRRSRSLGRMEHTTQSTDKEADETVRPESAPPSDGLQDQQESDAVFIETQSSELPIIDNLSQIIKEIIPSERSDLHNQVDVVLKQVVEIQSQVQRNANAIIILGEIKQKVTKLDTQFTTLDKSVNNIKESVKQEKSKIVSIENKLANISAEISGITQEREVISNQSQQTRADLDGIKLKVNSLTEEVGSVRNTSKVNEIILDSLRGEIRDQRKDIDLIKHRGVVSSTLNTKPRHKPTIKLRYHN